MSCSMEKKLDMYEVVPTIKKIPETKILYSFHLKYIYIRLLHLQNMCMFKYAGEKKNHTIFLVMFCIQGVALHFLSTKTTNTLDK